MTNDHESNDHEPGEPMSTLSPGPTSQVDSFVSGTRPLTDRLEEIIETWATSHYELVTLAAEFADSPEWILTGSPTPAHWLAIIADVEPCTTREWIRIGRRPEGVVDPEESASKAQRSKPDYPRTRSKPARSPTPRSAPSPESLPARLNTSFCASPQQRPRPTLVTPLRPGNKTTAHQKKSRPTITANDR